MIKVNGKHQISLSKHKFDTDDYIGGMNPPVFLA